jgi:hypothetical protein
MVLYVDHIQTREAIGQEIVPLFFRFPIADLKWAKFVQKYSAQPNNKAIIWKNGKIFSFF